MFGGANNQRMSDEEIEALTQKFSELILNDSEDSEDLHWNSFGSDGLFKSFQTIEELKTYIVETNIAILNTTQSLSKIETSMDKVLDEETIRILNLKKF